MAVVEGSLDVVQWLHETVEDGWTMSVMDEAAKHGRLDLVQWLHTNRSEGCTKAALNEAMTNGHLDVVQWLLANRSEGYSDWAFAGAARNGHVDMVEKLLAKQGTASVEWAIEAAATKCHVEVVRVLYAKLPRVSRRATFGAASNGHLEVVKIFHENQADEIRIDVMDFAMRYGHPDIVSWLHAHWGQLHTLADLDKTIVQAYKDDLAQWLYNIHPEHCLVALMNEAAANRQFSALGWLIRCQWTGANLMDAASAKGALQLVQYLHTGREGCMISAMDLAAQNGRLNVVNWVYDSQPEQCLITLMNVAAAKYQFAALRWLRQKWSGESLMDAASEKGALELVQYLHEHEAGQCSISTMDQAAQNEHFDVAQWLYENQTEYRLITLMNQAATESRFALLGWLRLKWEATNIMDEAAATGALELLKWLHSNPAERCTTAAMDRAAQNNHVNVVQWLHENRLEGCTSAAMESAIVNRQLSMVMLLYGRDEVKSWPRYHHTSILSRLALSNHEDNLMIVKYIVRGRQERFQTDAADNPFDNEALDVDGSTVDAVPTFETCVLTAVTKLCEAKHLPSELSERISEFTAGNPRDHVSTETALEHSWVHWLVQFSNHPTEDIVAFARRGDWNSDCIMHGRLAQQHQLRCSKLLMYLTAEKGNLELVKWHIGCCDVHSVDDWIYAATWVGRVDVIEWICKSYSNIMADKIDQDAEKLGPARKIMYHSLDASFTQVKERFPVDLGDIEASMSQEEEAARDGDLSRLMMMLVEASWSTNREPITSNMADLAAIYGHLHVLDYLLGRKLLTVRHQPQLQEWPKREDYSGILRRFLSHDNEKLLRFFRRERNMRLDTRTLDDAAYRGDLERVRLICIFDLVENTASAADIAAVRGDLLMLETLFTLGSSNSRCTTCALDGAAEEGHIRIVRYLNQRNAPCTRRAVDLSARNGHFDIVQYLLKTSRTLFAICSLLGLCTRPHRRRSATDVVFGASSSREVL